MMIPDQRRILNKLIGSAFWSIPSTLQRIILTLPHKPETGIIAGSKIVYPFRQQFYAFKALYYFS
jgi:hypothetical protein